MSALGQKQTLAGVCIMSALPPKADMPLTILGWFFQPTSAIRRAACHHCGCSEMLCDCARVSAARRQYQLSTYQRRAQMLACALPTLPIEIAPRLRTALTTPA